MNRFDPSSQLSRRTAAVELAAIIRMSQKARQLASAGHHIVSLTLGEPDFDTPRHIQAAATTAMANGFTHYSPVPGLPEMRDAVVAKLARENGIEYSADEICMTNGAKQAITNAAYALLDPGDELILLAPFWLSYEAIVQMAGGNPVILRASVEDGFKVPADRIAAAMTDQTKLIVLNTPCNPTGAMHSRSELEAIASVVKSHPSAMILSDEIYEYIVFDAEPVSIGSLDGMKDRTITVNGLSKGFAMTGWRLGYSAAPAPVTSAMAKVQSTFTAGANPFVQHAAIAALEGGRDEVEAMRASYQRRRDMVVSGLNAVPGIKAASPPGTFYIFPDVSAHFGKAAGNRRIDNVDELADWLLEDHHVATVPGSAFGDDRCIRLSFATADGDIKTGLERIAAAISTLN